jgi:dihydrodipicolinate synthase/N-acetylneuraminate lyase
MDPMKKISGVVPAIGTPLADGDSVDEAGVRRLTRFLVDGGVHALLANGSMGGFAFLPEEEQLRAIATVVRETDRKIPVIAGLGETGTIRAIRMARRICAEGVDYLSVLPPFYFLANQGQLASYFCEIAAAVDLPVFLYDNPVLTKNPIRPDTVALVRKLAPNVVGIKVSNSDCVNLQELLQVMSAQPGFSILTGSEFLMVVGIRMGCDGVVGGLFNLCPHLAVRCYDAIRSGDISRACALQQDLIGTWQVFRRGAIWGGFDEALRYLGICDRATGRPYATEITATERAEIRAILDRYVTPDLAGARHRG